MSKLRATLELAISEDEALAACRRALLDLGWSVLEDRERAVVAREDATEIATKVPGFGPISSHHAEEQSQVLARRIALLATGCGASDKSKAP